MVEEKEGIPKIISEVVSDDGKFPNSCLPILIYKGAMEGKEAGEIEAHFSLNQWSNAWHGGIFNFHHYHSNTHEVLSVITGILELQLGGPYGMFYELREGDVLIIPAGVAHKNLLSTSDLHCVGAYPGGKQNDMYYGFESDRPQAPENIAKVPLPGLDPIFATKGALHSLWTRS